MGYQGTDGLITVFPTRGLQTPAAGARAPRQKKAPKPKKPCVYGPRVGGRCPKKPRTPRGVISGITRNVATAAGASKGVSRALGTTLGAVGGAVATRVARSALTRAGGGAAAGALSTIGPRAALALGGGTILAAGLTAYFLTKYLIDSAHARRLTRADAASRAARAYRETRAEAVRLNGGKPLTGLQLQDLSDSFHAQLEALGLSTTELGGL